MDIEALEEMWKKDAEIDETNLSAEAGNIPKLHSKYYKIYFRSAMKTHKLKSELKVLEKEKNEYYSGSMAQEDLIERGWKPNPLKILRGDMDKYIQSDTDIVEACLKIDYHASMAKFLEDILKQIHNRNFIIKNMIDFLKFRNGG